MSPQPKQVVKLAMNAQESLRLPIGAEAAHLAFSGSRVFIGNFRRKTTVGYSEILLERSLGTRFSCNSQSKVLAPGPPSL